MTVLSVGNNMTAVSGDVVVSMNAKNVDGVLHIWSDVVIDIDYADDDAESRIHIFRRRYDGGETDLLAASIREGVDPSLVADALIDELRSHGVVFVEHIGSFAEIVEAVVISAVQS